MDKRNKHILINLTEDQYNQLLYIATQQRRKLADAAYIILTDSLHDEILKAVNKSDNDFHPLTFENK